MRRPNTTRGAFAGPRTALFAIALILAIRARTQAPFALRDGDRIVFYGDDITAVQFFDNPLEPRLYPSFVETYAITRFPHAHFDFVNSAWAGDRVSGGAGGTIDIRLQRDVIAYKPTVVTVMLGMNDGEMSPYHTDRFNKFASGFEHILSTLRSNLPEARVTAIKPSPYDEVTQQPDVADGGYNRVLMQYGTFIHQTAEREGLTIADLNTTLVAVLEKATAIDPATARKIIPDRIHPSAAGHLILAEDLLKAWNAPALVSAVRIDESRQPFIHTGNTTVRDLKIALALSWTQTDNALPFPIDMADPVVGLVVSCSDLVPALDQQTLQVNGLVADRYELRIDNDTIGVFTREQLREGINLALLDTPMKKQAIRVFDLVRARNNVHFGRWKRVQFAIADDSLPHKQEALDALEALEQDLLTEVRLAAEPKPHRFLLVPQ